MGVPQLGLPCTSRQCCSATFSQAPGWIRFGWVTGTTLRPHEQWSGTTAVCRMLPAELLPVRFLRHVSEHCPLPPKLQGTHIRARILAPLFKLELRACISSPPHSKHTDGCFQRMILHVNPLLVFKNLAVLHSWWG